MKTRKLIPTTMIAAALLSLSVMTSCKKDNSVSDNSTTEDVNANADRFQESEGVSSDVDVISDQAFEMHGVEMRNQSTSDAFGVLTCATVTNDTVHQIITVDFGTGCTGHNGHIRSGQIIIHYNGFNYFAPGFQRTVTFNNYKIDGRLIEGTRTITNNGYNAANHLNWSISAQNMRVTRPNGINWHQWNSERVREMLAGDSTLTDGTDDIYSITGTATGTNSNGNSCSANITTALIKEGSCHFRFVSGIIEITSSNHPTLTLDYGNGTCDDLATVTRNGVTVTIHIH